MKQLTHYDIHNNKQEFPITIVCDAIRTPENIGMCFRIAESFGVQKIYLHHTSPNLENRIVKKTARNTVTEIEHEIYSDFDSLVSELQSNGNTIIGIEITDKSKPIQEFDFSTFKNIVFILGSERKGIQQINSIEHTIHIPMYGRNSSMNVIHSLSIALYETTNQLKK